MRLKGRPLKHCRSKLSTISFHRSVLRPTFPLQIIRYWNPFTRRDLQLSFFYGAVSSSSHVTRHGMLNADNAGVLTPSTSHTMRKTYNFLKLSWWGGGNTAILSPGSNVDQATACCGTVFVFFFSLSKWIPAHYLEIIGVVQWSRTAKNRNEWSRYKQNSFNQSNVNATTLGVAHLGIKCSISPRFHQVAVAIMGLCRLTIYLFIYLLIYLFIIYFEISIATFEFDQHNTTAFYAQWRSYISRQPRN
jgi:hypothetical protein